MQFNDFICRESYGAAIFCWLWNVFKAFHEVDSVVGTFVDRKTSSRFTNVDKVLEALDKYGIKSTLPNTMGLHRVMITLMGLDKCDTHILDYESNHYGAKERKRHPSSGLVSANQIYIKDSKVFETVVFEDANFGMGPKASKFKLHHGCQYCFWALLIHPNDSVVIQKSLNKRFYAFEFTCLYDTKSTRKTESCKQAVNGIDQRMTELAGPTLNQYMNTPSCHNGNGKKFYKRYWNENYDRLMRIKRIWDPDNVFNHCHSLGSTNEECCP